MEKRTDLALEIRESFPEDDVEIKGVVLKQKNYERDRLCITHVIIQDEQGAEQMKKPIGTYVTVEFLKAYHHCSPKQQEETEEQASKKIAEILEDMIFVFEKKQKIMHSFKKKEKQNILVAGLGNRFATPDALGPFVLEEIAVNRHLLDKLSIGDKSNKKERTICAMTPGVMAQTGMESSEILGGIIDKINPDCLIVIDSLATRSVRRLCSTIQITDTGICPGAGIGNNRNAINQQTLHIPVIAIGVPTVVDAGTIVSECMEETLAQEGYSEQEIALFIKGLRKDNIHNMFVTPKDIDEQIRKIGSVVSKGINLFSNAVK